MSSGDRDILEGDHEWQAALLQHELSKRHNPAHSQREIEMARGRLIVEHKINEQHQTNARDILAEKFDPDHVVDPNREKEHERAMEQRRRRNEYRERLPLLNGGQNK